jgi:hypothetical protein
VLSLTFRLGHIAEEEEGAIMVPTALPGLADDRVSLDIHSPRAQLLTRNTIEELTDEALRGMPFAKASIYRSLQESPRRQMEH